MNCDGTLIASGELGGFQIDYGVGSVVVGPDLTTYTLDLPSGTYSIRMCSLDNQLLCSSPCSETNALSVTVP